MGAISVVATGFGPFPGAPENPTAALMERLTANPPELGADVSLHAFIVPTEYDGLAERVRLIGETAEPDIALHFGLAHSAKGFRLEQVARNRLQTGRVDAAGRTPPSAFMIEGAADLASTLPLARIEAALAACGLPVEFSDDCGDYLCNAIFYHSAGHLIASFQPRMAGFIHVPMTGPSLEAAALEAGARIIIAETVAAWREQAA